LTFAANTINSQTASKRDLGGCACQNAKSKDLSVSWILPFRIQTLVFIPVIVSRLSGGTTFMPSSVLFIAFLCG
jgi:hypothetical protein